MHHEDLTSRRFGRLVALEFAGRSKKGNAYWKCRCDCGNVVTVEKPNLKWSTVSCGCYRTEVNGTHHMTESPTYQSWCSLITRCTNQNRKDWKNYGGRGIKVCDRWLHSFENFLADMGPRPDGMTIDRIDNDGNYEPGNCRWATKLEQNRNTTRIRKLRKAS
jgi:hypothetical protein